MTNEKSDGSNPGKDCPCELNYYYILNAKVRSNNILVQAKKCETKRLRLTEGWRISKKISNNNGSFYLKFLPLNAHK